MASSFTNIRDHPKRRTTVGMTPLDEWSAYRRDLYLTTHNTHNRQTSMPPVGFEPPIAARERPYTYALDLRLRPRGQRDRHVHKIWLKIEFVSHLKLQTQVSLGCQFVTTRRYIFRARIRNVLVSAVTANCITILARLADRKWRCGWIQWTAFPLQDMQGRVTWT
jgi:hypothetical protein